MSSADISPLIPSDAVQSTNRTPITAPKLRAPPDALAIWCISAPMSCCADPGSSPDIAFTCCSIVRSPRGGTFLCLRAGGVGGHPREEGQEARFDVFVAVLRNISDVAFLNAAISYVRDQLGLPGLAFLHEIVCNYPALPRMLC